ncbi:MAG: hypothetical protein ACYDHO_06785 [Gaiellaceae bacterium]
MRRRQPKQLLLLVALALVIGGVTLSTPASSAPVISGKKANQAVRALIRSDLIRAEIVTYDAGTVGDYRVDRGVVRKLQGRRLTLLERDGSVVRIRLSSATLIKLDNRRVSSRRVRRGMRATAMRMGDATASWLQITKRLPDRSLSRIRALLSNSFLRAEVVSWAGGAVLDNRTDTGVISSVDSVSLVLEENDGTIAEMQFDDATEVWINGALFTTSDLAVGMSVTTIGSGDGMVSQIWAQGKKNPGVGKK